jgi:hypothetical protein
MFHMINASTNNVVTYGGNIYYVGAFNRTTWTTYRGQ